MTKHSQGVIVPPMVNVQPQYGNLEESDYTAKINSPAKSAEYFEQFHKPVIEEAKRGKKEGEKVFLLDLACGHGHELDLIKDDPDVQIVATDISNKTLRESTRKRVKGALVFASDVEHSPLKDGACDIGIATNAVVYKPDHMLKTMHKALKPGGKCVMNFRIHGNPHNNAFYDHYLSQGGVISDTELTITNNGQSETFQLKVLDYNGCQDEQIRCLDKQVYFQSEADIVRLVEFLGFNISAQQKFNFSSPVNSDNEIEVLTLQKVS